VYSLRRILAQEPAAIVGVIMLGLAFAIAMDWVSMSNVQLASLNALLVGTLNLLYVRPLTVTKSGLNELANPPGG
jgi:hypothetical protein